MATESELRQELDAIKHQGARGWPGRLAITAWNRVLQHPWVFLVAVALFILTAVIEGSALFQFDITHREAASFEVVGVVAAAAIAAVAYSSWALTGARSTLLVGYAFLAVGANQLLFETIAKWGSPADSLWQEAYFWAAGWWVAAVLLVAAASYRRRAPDRFAHPLAVAIAGAVAVLAVLTATQTILWAVRGSLPALIQSGAADPNSTATLTELTPTALVVGGLALLVYLVLAFGFLADRRGKTYPTGDWLSVALILAAFSQLHEILAPDWLSSSISLADVLRLSFDLSLFFGLLWEVRGLLARERAQHAQLVALNTMKGELSQLLTHDLMNSVGVVRNQTARLSDGWAEMDEDLRREAVRVTARSAAQMSDLVVESVAALSLDAETLPIHPRPALAVDLVGAAVEHSDSHSLTVDVDPDLEDALVLVDEPRLLRVFGNLLSNAMKYSPQGSPIEVALRDRGPELWFSVADRGTGIPSEELPLLFQRFSRLSTGRDKPGMGVGLYLVKNIVEAHGGRVWAESEPDHGCTFVVALPRWEGLR